MANAQRLSRPAEIDASRGLAILLVVYAHGLDLFSRDGAALPEAAFRQWQFLASCGMPFFFLASGLVYRVKSHRKAIASALTLIFLAYAYHVIAWGLGNLQDEATFTWKVLVYPMIKGSGVLPVAMWFLVTLAYVQLIFHFFQRSGLAVRCAIAAALVLLFVAGRLSGYNFFYMRALAPALLFLAFGYALAKTGFLFWEPARSWQRWALMAALMTFTAVLAPLNRGCLLDIGATCPYPDGTFWVFLMDGDIGFVPVFLLSALIGSYACWLLVRRLCAVFPSLGERLTRLGRNSLALFTLNAFVLAFAQPLLRPFVPADLPLALLIALPVGLCIAQLAVLPWNTRPFGDRATERSGSQSD